MYRTRAASVPNRSPLFTRRRTSALLASLLMVAGCSDLTVPSDPVELERELFKTIKLGESSRAHALLEAGAPNDARDMIGWTPLHYAVNRFHRADFKEVDVIKALIAAEGTDINSVANDGSTPISLAAKWGATEAVNVLLAAGVEISGLDGSGSTPLINAIDARQYPMVDHLIARGADVNQRLENGANALYYAINKRDTHSVRTLIENGSSVKGTDKSAPPIIFAAGMHNVEVVRLLVEAGADVNAVNKKNGFTPLYQSVRSGPEMVKFLLDKGAKNGVSDNQGITPLDKAKESGDEEAIKLLSAPN
ncbi:MAG: ankyrin repeat protein [Myxococcota bacterium]|jgi:ankyrin repeat protein